MRQVVSFALSAVYSGVWFTRWARDGVKNRMWPQLGWFSALVCVGSVIGAVAWVTYMQTAALQYQLPPTATRQQGYLLYASTFRWFAAFNVLYPVEFLCFIIVKLIMLGRLTSNATRNLQSDAQVCDM